MKFYTPIIILLCLTLFACSSADWLNNSGVGSSHFEALESARGSGVGSCAYPNATLPKENGYDYLEEHGLPTAIEGNFLCEGQTPVLPKDCQGREFRSLQELEVYWEKYQLPRGILDPKCTNGIPSIPPEDMDWWKMREGQMATCKDPQGNPRRCV